MGQMMSSFSAVSQAPSVGMLESTSTPDAHGKKVRVYQKGDILISRCLLLSVNKQQQSLGTFLKLPFKS